MRAARGSAYSALSEPSSGTSIVFIIARSPLSTSNIATRSIAGIYSLLYKEYRCKYSQIYHNTSSTSHVSLTNSKKEVFVQQTPPSKPVQWPAPFIFNTGDIPLPILERRRTKTAHIHDLW